MLGRAGLKIKNILFIVSILPCCAKDLGTIGTTFEIVEKSLLKVIEEKLHDLQVSGKLAEHQKELQMRVRQSIDRPRPVEGLQKTTTYQSRDYDPSFVLDKDIKDHEGNLIAIAGTRYKPLDYYSFGKPLLLIDGDDTSQVKWALSQEGKIVLTRGKPMLLTKEHKRTFFFDQGGLLVKKFDISKIPVRVSQKDKVLLIEEIPIETLLQTKGHLDGE
ncbi:MAG: type-F conjugative transfer system protein TraW [Alphaproteobacteria bacterium]|nr:type-F conjugative transfer system protein TraW [Alphaproteobacteria bacterium]